MDLESNLPSSSQTYYYSSEMPRLNSRKRRLDVEKLSEDFSTKNLLKNRTPFDKQKFKEALEEFANCPDILCDPLFRNNNFNFYTCQNCWVHWFTLNDMLIFNETIDSLQDHAYKAFEYVAQVAANLNSGSAKDKGFTSYVRLQALCKKISISMQRVFQISDKDFQLLKKCSLMSCFIYPMYYTIKIDPFCEIESCTAKYDANVTLKQVCYDAKNFKSLNSSGELYNFKLCLIHAHAFFYVHKISHVFYNGYQNFSYWIEQNNKNLHESFDSKLKVELGTSLQTQASSSISTCTSFCGINQEVYQNLTKNFVDLITDIETKLPRKTITHTLLNRLWFSKIVKLKNKRIVELGYDMFPTVMAMVDENKEQMRLSTNSKYAHLLYSDFD